MKSYETQKLSNS